MKNHNTPSSHQDEDIRVIVHRLKRISHQMICLRNISQLLFQTNREKKHVLQDLVHLLLEGWQYPAETCARIFAEGKEYRSVNFAETSWKQSADIPSSDETLGTIEVYYLVSKPEADEGPFLEEERYLLDTVALELATFLDKKRIEGLQRRQSHELNIYTSLLRHDLRNDLAVILGNIDLARMVVDESSVEMLESIESIESVCDRMMTLIDAFSQKTESVETNLVAIVTMSCTRARTSNKQQTINLIVEDECTELRVPESTLLIMVFDNLLRNTAIHAGEDSTVEVRVFKEGASICVVVSDDGPGIGADIQDRLFQRGASTRGGGLGLYLSREILAAIDSTIEVIPPDSGTGAVFKVVFPVVQ